MKRIVLLIVFLLFYSILAFAQTEEKIGYNGGVDIGMLVRAGGNGIAGQVSTTHGISYDKFSAGAGIGVIFDCFQNVSFPVFLEGRYSFSRNSLAPFVGVRGGCWVPYGSVRRQKAMLFVEPMIGLDVKKLSFMLSLQNMNSKDERETYVSFTVGFRFGH